MLPKITIAIANIHESHQIKSQTNLSEVLNASNSKLLFGCRTGICGTCLVKVLEGAERLKPPSQEEQEFLEIISNGEEGLRLACQLSPTENLKIDYRGKSS